MNEVGTEWQEELFSLPLSFLSGFCFLVLVLWILMKKIWLYFHLDSVGIVEYDINDT